MGKDRRRVNGQQEQAQQQAQQQQQHVSVILAVGM